MKRVACRYRHLPFTPRPVPGELVSSWLLRVAAQNCIGLGELVHSVQLAYPGADVPFASLDYDLPSDFRTGLAQLCRTLPNTIRKLELQNQFPGVPHQMFLAHSCHSDSTRIAGKRARYEFCLSCLHEPSAENSPAVIRAVWSLAPITHCHLHQCPLISHCPRCQRTDPLRFPTLPRDPRVRCRECDRELTANLQPFDHPPHRSFVMDVERAYLGAITGLRPASLPLNQVSARRFREIVEYFALLFSRRPTWQSRHIPARYFVDLRLALRYFYTPGVAEAQLPFFSWKWRYAVMYCVATAILGFPDLLGGIGSMHSQNSKADPFRDLLLYLTSFEQQRGMVHASHGWPENMQRRLWMAVQRVEGRMWNSPNSLRFKCPSQSSH